MAEDDGNILEIHWAMMLYQRILDLLSGPKFQIVVEKKSLRRGHMDLFIKEIGTAVDYIHNKTFFSVEEHHKRFDPNAKRPKPGAEANKSSVGRYVMPEVKDYRIVHFLLPLAASASTKELEKYGLNDHGALKEEYQAGRGRRRCALERRPRSEHNAQGPRPWSHQTQHDRNEDMRPSTDQSTADPCSGERDES